MLSEYKDESGYECFNLHKFKKTNIINMIYNYTTGGD